MKSVFYSSTLPALLLLFCAFIPGGNPNDSKSVKYHKRAITIDSHTDTPMRLMRKDFDFGKYNDPWKTGTKLDLPRMDKGDLDAVFFAAFIGQGERSPEGNLAAYNEARAIIDTVYRLVNRYPEKLGLAASADEIEARVREGKHAIILGLENGYPIGTNINLADTFFNLGVRYITLCHTKNNDICDSSTDEEGPEHSGLSSLGEKLVGRMNQLGVMVDVSHISDDAFYDVLRLSKDPVIASHSSARALCDHPRNLDDAMLKAIASNGGVVQVCILSAYIETPEAFPARDSARAAVTEKHGDYYSLDAEGREDFLTDWYQVDKDFPPKLANVQKIADHIDHIVKTAGINHVGIGTDFDGGGGVYGCFDVSELPNITTELVARGYSYREIEKIWGGNLLRVMREVEKQ